MMTSGWNWNGWSPTDRHPSGRHAAGLGAALAATGLLALTASAAVGQGTPMTPERLTSLTQGRTMSLRSRALPLSHLMPGVTQQMLYRIKLAPETPEVHLSVFCANVRLSRFEAAVTTLFGYRLVGRSQGEGMGLVLIPDPEAVAAAAGQRAQGRAAVEAGIARAVAWLKQPAAIDAATRTRCPAASALRDDGVRRAFLLYAGLSRAQRDRVMAGHPLIVPVAALPAASRALVPGGPSAAKSLTFYLFHDPWLLGSEPRLAVRAEPSGKTWLSCPPLALAPAHTALPPEVAEELRTKLTGMPDLEDLDPGEEAPAILEWIADEGKIPLMAEVLRPYPGDTAGLKKLAASCSGLTREEALDRVTTFFSATWRYEQDWILIQRRSTEMLTHSPSPAPLYGVKVGRSQ
jgi:hypothetical protein